ncbi:MAG TPA: hypothetical protein VD913_00625, partial [bacterium]|nr:hypothetical protein [bacterium]
MTGNELFPKKILAVALLFFAFLSLQPLQIAFAASEKKPETQSGWNWKEFLLGKEEPTISEQVPPLSVSVVASRFPVLKTELENVPWNVSYKSEEDLEMTHSRTFQDA